MAAAAAQGATQTGILYHLPPPNQAWVTSRSFDCQYGTIAWLAGDENPIVAATREFAKDWFTRVSATPQPDWARGLLATEDPNQRLLTRLKFSPLDHLSRPFRQILDKRFEDRLAGLEEDHRSATHPGISAQLLATTQDLLSRQQTIQEDNAKLAHQQLLNCLKPLCEALHTEIFKTDLGQSLTPPPTMEDLQRIVINQFVITDALAQAFGLVKVSCWNPNERFEQLLQSLESGGPIVVFGEFGEAYHEQPSTQLPYDVMGKKMWGWAKQSHVTLQAPSNTKGYNPKMAHAIIVVGATTINVKSREVQTVVYQDVRNPEKLYAMSYPAFSKTVVPSTGIRVKNPSLSRLNEFSTFGFQDPAWDLVVVD